MSEGLLYRKVPIGVTNAVLCWDSKARGSWKKLSFMSILVPWVALAMFMMTSSASGIID